MPMREAALLKEAIIFTRTLGDVHTHIRDRRGGYLEGTPSSDILARMHRRRVIALVLLVLLVAASVSYTSGYTLDLVDSDGRPQTAYALYTYQGYWLNPVHPVSYNATPLTVVRSDDNGRLTIPAAVHVHWPFPLQTHPKLWIEMIYVPRLHNAWARIIQRSPASEVGIWQMTTRNRATVFDVSDRPEHWAGTLSNLSFFMIPAVRDVDHSRAGPLLELIGQFQAEYNAFLMRYDDSPRPLPPMPPLFTDDEKRAWKAMVDTDLSRRPTWGLEIRRLYEGEVSNLTEVEASVKR
jgi:hypothetical protein